MEEGKGIGQRYACACVLRYILYNHASESSMVCLIPNSGSLLRCRVLHRNRTIINTIRENLQTLMILSTPFQYSEIVPTKVTTFNLTKSCHSAICRGQLLRFGYQVKHYIFPVLHGQHCTSSVDTNYIQGFSKVQN